MPSYSTFEHREEQIDKAIMSAQEEAARRGEPVIIEFNKIELVVTADSELDKLTALFHEKVDKYFEEYNNSPASKALAEQMRLEREAAQKEGDQLISILPTVAALGEAALVQWVGKFSRVNEDVSYDRRAMAATLKEAGYTSAATIDSRTAETNPTKYAQWMIGQAIGYLEEGREIPPIFQNIAQEYSEKFSEKDALQSNRTDGKAWMASLGNRSGLTRG